MDDLLVLPLPQKKYFRTRAHSNPLSDQDFDAPLKPADYDWPSLYDAKFTNAGARVEFADIGCGYGGLLVALSPLFPDTLMVGMEIRPKVAQYVKERSVALRSQHPGQYGNINCIRTNAMRYMANYFERGQLTKMFFLFPDPHWKKTKHKWRVISRELISEYAFFLAVGGIVYTATDVEEVHIWMRDHFTAHPLFEPLTEEEADADPVTALLFESTEEGKKVTRNGGKKYRAIFRRISDPFSRSIVI